MNKDTNWYTNGKYQLLVHKGDQPPEGYHKGRLKSSKETRIKISRSLVGNQRKKGKTESEATRSKKSKAMIGNTNSAGQDNHGHIGLIHIHKGNKGRKCKPEELFKYCDLGYEIGESPLHIRNKRANHSESKPEKEIREYLSKIGIKVIPQYQIPGHGHHYDFYLPEYKLLAEFDGTYWHKSQDYNNDPRQINAESNGFRYLVIKEFDYMTKGRLKHVKSILKEFIDILNPTSHS